MYNAEHCAFIIELYVKHIVCAGLCDSASGKVNLSKFLGGRTSVSMWGGMLI